MHVCGVTLTGKLNIFQWKALLNELTRAMNMTPVHRPAVWNYPVAGAGGNGMTMVQPITESFLALDTWEDFGGAYLFICSCRDFKPALLWPIFRRYDLNIGADFFQTLSLKHG